jgi:hypothetical protein
MTRATKAFSFLSLLAMLMLPDRAAWSAIDPEDRKLIDAASREEIVRECRNCSAAEKEVESRIRQATAGTATANVAGIAAFALLGFGFFTWQDNSDARETLAEPRDIRIAIAEGARKKGCRLYSAMTFASAVGPTPAAKRCTSRADGASRVKIIAL